jgi:hypothetical protein
MENLETKEEPIVGPGHYNPNLKAVKKTGPSFNWGISKTKRSQTTGNQRNPKGTVY